MILQVGHLYHPHLPGVPETYGEKALSTCPPMRYTSDAPAEPGTEQGLRQMGGRRSGEACLSASHRSRALADPSLQTHPGTCCGVWRPGLSCRYLGACCQPVLDRLEHHVPCTLWGNESRDKGLGAVYSCCPMEMSKSPLCPSSLGLGKWVKLKQTPPLPQPRWSSFWSC